ncbi:MAG: adenylyltransferase/cytidyltransferase family protein [Desulfobacterales bacterium]|nr:adenylyltransferase/cytidyltransferase family protein [Desulfobacterales bacterium]
MKRGLTLGKFAPFHKGHQHLLETALSEMDEVIVIVYNADEVTDIPIEVRAGWIRTLYPRVRVVEARDGPQMVGDDPRIRSMHEDYIINRLKISGITCFYSGEFYGDHMSRALGAVNRQVDPGRKKHPISGTRIRENPFKFREWVHPVVFRDLTAGATPPGATRAGENDQDGEP